MRTYEGGSPGPTLRLKPGDALKLRLANEFPPNRDAMPSNISIPHQFNNTNFHFHGSHVSPSGIADNVMRSMVPGESYDIEINLPKDHTRGTYWYHPHHHGSADVQVASGMAGAIIVEGDFADVPEIANAKERLLVLGQVVYDENFMIEGFDTLRYDITGGADAAKFTINATTGLLSFVAAPSASAPTDADGDGRYQVTVRVRDYSDAGATQWKGGSDTQDLTVTVIAQPDTTAPSRRSPRR